MKTLLGFNIKHTGSITLEGFTKREIGWLPQKTQHQKDFPASVYEVVMSGFAGGGFFGTFASNVKDEYKIEFYEKSNFTIFKFCISLYSCLFWGVFN